MSESFSNEEEQLSSDVDQDNVPAEENSQDSINSSSEEVSGELSPEDSSAADSAEAKSDGESAEAPAVAAPIDFGSAKKAVVEEDQPKEFEWYVLSVQSNREDTVSNNLRKKLALHSLEHFVKDIVVPKQKMTEIKEGKKRVRAQKVYPGYIFMHMALEDDLWYLIRDTSGIGVFVGSNAKPEPMKAKEVASLLAIVEEKEEPQEVKIDLVKHDGVKIKEGPFENFDGVVEEINPARGIVRVMVTIFGRATPVDLEYWQVEKL